MTELIKSRWESDGDTMRFSMPLSKVDKKNRLVSGWATLDNVDTQGDIVLAEASQKAFSRARGNLREMHQPIAVGKIVSFREDEYFSPDDNKFYRGIFVTARVSEGAEDTWKKVLDETLTGFSIGGSINKVSNKVNKDGSSPIRVIEDYDLVELSLVDNPANQHSNITGVMKTNIFSIEDTDGSVTVKGMLAETEIENVFICENDNEIQAKVAESAECLECGTEMKNIGWFESGKDRAEKVREILTKFKTPDTNTEGGVEMDKEEITKAAETEETAEVTEVEDEELRETPTAINEDGETTSDGEEAADVNEGVTDEEEVISKKIDELKDVVTETLEKTRSETTEAIETLEKKIQENNEEFMTKFSELEKRFEGIGEDLETEKNRLAALEAKLSKINDSGALRKSADLDEEPAAPTQKKTTWDGAFSIDNLR